MMSLNTTLNKNIVLPNPSEYLGLVAELTIPIHESILPITFIVGSIDPIDFSIAITFVIVELTFVDSPICPFVETLATFTIVGIHALH
jgi:hypothetical protein